jgi:HTH-type transcriptional regulator, sugar sensing transcriptional regulator
VDAMADLMQIGFTEYEAKVYLALLRENPATGYQISKTSGVPRSMVYDALSRLHGRGAVLESIEDRATLYRPVAPELLLERHEDDHRQLLSHLREGLNTFYTTTDDERIWTISGQRLALTYAAQMIREAQSEVFLVLMDEDVDTLSPEIKSACDRGITVNTLLVGERDLECGNVAHHPPLESELQGLSDTLLVVADSRETLVASKRREMTATITRNANFVLIARQFVWMELFTQRVYARLGNDLLERLEPQDRQIFESLNALKETPNGKRNTDKKQRH